MINHATDSDITEILQIDKHIEERVLSKKITNREVYVIRDASELIGTLRYSLFWDNIPFMNLLSIREKFQKKGYGKRLVNFWEEEMKRLGYRLLMTSTQANESAQHFYRHLGYSDIGGFILPTEPLEIVFLKKNPV